MFSHITGPFPGLSLPLGGDMAQVRCTRRALAAMFRQQADILMIEGDHTNAKGLRRRARLFDAQEVRADLSSGARVVMGVTGHA